ncbi:ribonuclease H [Tanacetum coccineum]
MVCFESMWLRDESIHNVVRDGWVYGLAAGMQHDSCSIVSECAKSHFDGSTCDEQQVLREQIKELLTHEELMWKQHNRVQWLREGDKNTRFFHTRASNRCRRNGILRLKGPDGRWVEEHDEVCNLVTGYFSELFSSLPPQDCESVVNDIDRSLTDNERQALERRVTSSEVYEALIQIDPSKAPGPDGMTVMFYQKFWCFMAKKDGRKGALALKIDMSKAYDRVEWPFIQVVLSKFGFPSYFSNLIMACVSSVSFSFNINGQVSGHVTPTRGLRQGDPIPPYLFVMCAEVLSSMIRKSIMEGHIHGVKVCRGAPEISHLFFADDGIFFTRSSVEESCRLKSIFTLYCQASGQVINYEKSKISFNANVNIHVQTRIIECWNVREVVHQNKYLGLSHPSKAKTRGVTSWVSSQHNGVNNRENYNALSKTKMDTKCHDNT